MKNKVLCIGSLVLDIAASAISRNKQWEEKQRINDISFFLGGDAANQSVRMAGIGLEPLIVSAVGNDINGSILKKRLIEAEVRTDYLYIKEDHKTGTAVVLIDENGERTTFSVRGAYCEIDRNDIKDILFDDIAALSIAGLFTEPKLEEDGGMLELLKKAKERNIPVFADLANDKLNKGIDGIKEFLPYITYFLPSLSDAVKMNDLLTAEDNAALYRRYGCKSVIIKCGAEGCYILSDDYEGWIKALKVDTIDTTGAGDCMAALFVEGILSGERIDKACSFACAGATLSTLYKGASGGSITKNKIADFLQSIGNK